MLITSKADKLVYDLGWIIGFPRNSSEHVPFQVQDVLHHAICPKISIDPWMQIFRGSARDDHQDLMVVRRAVVGTLEVYGVG